MDNKTKNIPVSAALPTAVYWLVFIILSVALCVFSYNNAKTSIKNINDNIFYEDIGEIEANDILTSAVVVPAVSCTVACAWGIVLNIALRHKNWQARWLLIYIVTVTVLSIVINSIVAGKFVAGTPDWIWWCVIGIYRCKYVDKNFLPAVSKKATAPKQTLDCPTCPICQKYGSKYGNKFYCSACGVITLDENKECVTPNADTQSCETVSNTVISELSTGEDDVENK
jgi:hypothetical protein